MQVLVVEERAAVEEALAQIPDRPLHLALGLGPIGAAGTRPKAPVRSEAQKLAVEHEALAAESIIREHHGAHLVEQQLLGHAAE